MISRCCRSLKRSADEANTDSHHNIHNMAQPTGKWARNDTGGLCRQLLPNLFWNDHLQMNCYYKIQQSQRWMVGRLSCFLNSSRVVICSTKYSVEIRERGNDQKLLESLKTSADEVNTDPHQYKGAHDHVRYCPPAFGRQFRPQS